MAVWAGQSVDDEFVLSVEWRYTADSSTWSKIVVSSHIVERRKIDGCS